MCAYKVYRRHSEEVKMSISYIRCLIYPYTTAVCHKSYHIIITLTSLLAAFLTLFSLCCVYTVPVNTYTCSIHCSSTSPVASRTAPPINRSRNPNLSALIEPGARVSVVINWLSIRGRTEGLVTTCIYILCIRVCIYACVDMSITFEHLRIYIHINTHVCVRQIQTQ